MPQIQSLVTLFVFALGTVIGSFLNVCIYRLPRGLTINEPSRSFCPKCRNAILWSDNIPILSYLRLGGKCRYCGEPISVIYLIIELVTGLLFAATFAKLRYLDGAAYGPASLILLLEALLVVATATDFEFRIIPEEISVFGILTGIVASTMIPELHVGIMPHQTCRAITGIIYLDGFLSSLIGLLTGGGIVFLAAIAGYYIFKKEAMGGGDVMLMAMVGAFLGWKAGVIVFFLAPFLGIIYGVVTMFLTGDHYMPYGPWLAASTVVYIFARDWFARYLNEYADIIVSLVKLVF